MLDCVHGHKSLFSLVVTMQLKATTISVDKVSAKDMVYHIFITQLHCHHQDYQQVALRRNNHLKHFLLVVHTEETVQ